MGDYSSAYSISSISINIFFDNFNSYRICKRIPEDLSIYIRRGYFGGRCEVYGNPYPTEKLFHFDYSGMYGQVMLEKFPVGCGVYAHSASVDSPGFYYIEWYTDSELPVLPMRTQSGKLMFYKGSGEGLY